MPPRNSSRKPCSPSLPKAIRFVVRILLISAPFHCRKKIIQTGAKHSWPALPSAFACNGFRSGETPPISLARGRKVIYRQTPMRMGRRAHRPLRRTVPYGPVNVVHTYTQHTHTNAYILVYIYI